MFDPLWVPIISHYAADGSGLDAPRCRAHLDHNLPFVRQYLIAGTTGDGWDMSDAVLDQWLDLCSSGMRPDQAFLVGSFAPDAAGVIARARRIEAHFAAKPSPARFVGLTLCAQVEKDASQEAILAHFREILAATTAPVAIYQLPQVTQCEISPDTFATLAADPRVILLKDTSGGDAVATSGVSVGASRLLRGAEGDYARHLKPLGAYDGWLLSTANMFGAELRRIADDVAQGRTTGAAALSEKLTALVQSIFAAAATLGRNAFADANRGGDHIFAYGQDWRTAPPPRRSDGSILPEQFLAGVAEAIAEAGIPTGHGYLRSPPAGH